eukprot:gnl/Dysnectes_brevis/6311_a9692_277.p1 GENE.gnl/Dysnectes_brevis/6311_a9692_277~~gnl/Dysnectes_brevis/6311_a9692_277.p1  ORF type:complete len:889 (+),score=436.04 gnl/Dysnectes_brevis/6311_a9692_277:49-2715(+)
MPDDPDAQKDKDYTLSIDESTFEAIERDFHEVLSELVGDSSLELFRAEYEKLHRALKKSHENEKRLITRVRSLAQELGSNQSKIKTALKLSKEDQATIASLKAEIDKAWRIVDMARQKETTQNEQLDKLRAEVDALSRLVDKGPMGVGVPEEATVEDLVRAKEILQQEHESQASRMGQLRQELAEQLERIRQLESEKLNSELRIRGLKELVSQHRAEGARELARREHLDKELDSVRRRAEEEEEKTRQHSDRIARLQSDLATAEQHLSEEKEELARVKSSGSQLQDRYHKLRQDLNEQTRQNGQLLAAAAEKRSQIQAQNAEIQSARQATAKVQRTNSSLTKQVEQLQGIRRSVESQRDQLKGRVGELESELGSQRQHLLAEQKKMTSLKREHNIMFKSLHVAQVSSAEQSDIVKVAEGQMRNLEQEVAAYKAEASKQRKVIFSLEREREKYGRLATEAQQRYLQALQEVKMRDMAIADLQKKIGETEAKLKQQQNLYESVRADRNLYSKNLVESQDEIAELRRKFRIMDHVLDQLKEEIRSKNEALVKEHFDRREVLKEKDGLVQELEKARRQIREAEQTIATQRAEIAKLNHIIAEADTERQRQGKEYKIVVTERDILGTQLIRRNDELALLYEKIRIQRATLAKGERQYGDRIEDIRLLRIKLADLRRQLAALRRQASALGPYRQEIQRLQRELLDERTKCRALSSELQNPMNVHRWRQLEGSDPSTFELLRRVQSLQKRLIAKTEEVASKDLVIEEKERLYSDLKAVLSRQPGPEVLEQLTSYQQAIKQKTRQLQTMSAELAMYQTQVDDYKGSIERLTQEMQQLKRRYFEYRKREYETLQRRAEAGHDATIPLMEDGEDRRFVGGGFSLSKDGRPKRGDQGTK